MSMPKNLSRFVSASRPDNSRRIWFGGGGERSRRRRCHKFNIRIRQSGVPEKFQYAGLDSGPSSAFKCELQIPGSLANSRGTDEGSKLISIPRHYAAQP
jgi:hypothetical protein